MNKKHSAVLAVALVLAASNLYLLAKRAAVRDGGGAEDAMPARADRSSRQGMDLNPPIAQSKLEPVAAPLNAGSRAAVTAAITQPASGMVASAASRQLEQSAPYLAYGGFVRQSRLAKDDADRFIEIIGEYQSAIQDVSRATSADAAARNEMLRGLQKDLDQKLSALLGREKFSQFEQYRRNLAEHMSISQLRLRLAREGVDGPSETQEQALFYAMMEEKARIPMPTQRDVRAPSELPQAHSAWKRDYDVRLLDRARAILTEEQFTRFQDQVQTQPQLYR